MATQDALLNTTKALEVQGNGISLAMVDFLNNVKSHPLGFRELGLDFLAICAIVSSLKSSLVEHFETNQPFPERAIPELIRIVHKTSDDFSQLQQLLTKFIDFEKGGAFARLQKTWRMLFADKDIAKVHHSLQENKGALNMAMLLTNINPHGAAAFSYEYGLLAARLQQSSAGSVSELDGSSSYAASVLTPTISSDDSDKIVIPSVSELTIDDGLVPVEHQSAHDQNYPESTLAGAASPQPECVQAAREVPESPVSAIVPTPNATPVSGVQKPAKVAVRVDRAKVPRRTPTSTVGANSAALKNTLVSAVEGRKHKIVEQLLNRGVPPDTGPEKNAVHIAVDRKDTDSLRLLLEFGADPDSLNSHKRTPISYACYHKEELVKLLLDFGANPNLSAPEWLPMPWAIDANKLEHVQLLLQYGADPNGVSKNGQTNLFYTAERPRAMILQELLDWGADPNKANSSRDTPLLRASESRQVESIKILLAHGANPNTTGQHWAPLPWLLDSKNVEIVRYLLDHGGDPNGFSNNGENHMVYAAERTSPELIQALIDHGGDVNLKNKSGNTPLVAASCSRKFDNVKFLLANGAHPNESSAHWTALPWLLDSGNVEVVRYFLEHGGDPNGFSKNGENNMVYAAERSSTELIRALIDHGGNVNLTNKSGNTPLVAASCNRKLDNVKFLISNGADPNLSSAHWAPLPWIIDSKNEEMVRYMLEHGADPNGTSKNRTNNMFYAAEKPYANIMQAMIDHGGDVNKKNAGDQTLLEVACRSNHCEVVKVLLANGANPNEKGQDYPIYHTTDKLECLKILLAGGADPKFHPGLVEFATHQNKIETVKVLLDHGVDIDEPHLKTFRALGTAMRDNRPEIFTLLVERGANPNIKGDMLPIERAVGKPQYLKPLLAAGADTKLAPGVLELAVWHNEIESVRILLDVAKVDINEKRPAGHGALTTAIRDNRVEILAELIARKADLNMETCDGLPLVMAAKFKDQTRFQMLLDAGADVNKTDRHRGYSALMQACDDGRMDAVKLLVQRGADVEKTNRNGESAMDIAARQGHEEIVMALLEGME